MIVLIPAFEPGPALDRLVRELVAAEPALGIVIVDDGSGPDYASVFAAVAAEGATVLRHDTNRGKGAALKTGIAHILAAHPGDDVVTADADGQHTPRDILRVADAVRTDADAGAPALVLGCRGFTGAVPARSRVGNALARGIFRLAAGWSLSDTQTGLRGIPSEHLAWVRDQWGDRFEFEQNVLLQSRRAGIAARELPIATVYLEGNASSHFRPVADSWRVALPLALFTGSSLIAFVVDTIALLVLTALTGLLVPSIIAARVLSASVNFAVNRRVVFGDARRGRMPGQALRYGVLAVALLASNVVWLEALTDFGIPLLLAKIATEAVLFVTSYGVQRTFVFGRAELVSDADARHRSPIAATARMDTESYPSRRNP
ncbi:bifunctional glycosyltransferase family 2/GtrA family protein [Microbacterium sp. 2FI]|uniref:bifunctional glycosyltransferase family 2/GtrA family protein n=1 Tax=Microbacterium sp. 2FI TaxID=2502193 RepID=UPI0010F7A35B|nr:bifunctional glycosyltransferase family 2/GtrA family protein [Microbacterium sp. 2FI]